MGIFDFFKKKQPATTAQNVSQAPDFPENKLEEALRRAASEVAYRPEFYRLLLSEDLIAMTDGHSGNEGERILEEDTEINLMTFKGGTIPVFTSAQRISDADQNEEVPIIAMNGKAFLEMTRGATLVLNPYSEFGKELLPDEIESILDGTILTQSHKKVVAEKDTQVLLAQPKVYPTDMVNSLKIVFANQPAVKKAYLAIMSDGSDEKPHLVIAIDAETDGFQGVVNEAGFCAQQFLEKGDIVNFMKIGNSGLDGYFINETEPFYQR